MEKTIKKLKVYCETSFLSWLVSRPSTIPDHAVNQAYTRNGGRIALRNVNCLHLDLSSTNPHPAMQTRQLCAWLNCRSSTCSTAMSLKFQGLLYAYWKPMRFQRRRPPMRLTLQRQPCMAWTFFLHGTASTWRT